MSTYCCSDLHGCFWAYEKIKGFLKPEDKVYCLGDCGDRGPDGWELIKTIYKDQQFIYLKGNHEDMLTRAMKEFIDKGGFGEEFNLLCYNGGYNTFEGWLTENYFKQAGWMKKLIEELPIQMTYINKDKKTIILNHSGYFDALTNVEDILILWDREQLKNPIWNYKENIIVVHGHTPTPFLPFVEKEKEEANPKIQFYCNNHKIDIDLGTFITNKVALLNLDTLEPIYFYKKGV